MNRDHISLKLPNKEERKSEEDEFTMYVMDLSYFSGKLECYFNYQVHSLLVQLVALLLLILQLLIPLPYTPDQKFPLAGSQVAERGTKLD